MYALFYRMILITSCKIVCKCVAKSQELSSLECSKVQLLCDDLYLVHFCVHFYVYFSHRTYLPSTHAPHNTPLVASELCVSRL